MSEEYGCSGCHSTDGQTFVGPTWLGVFGSMEEFEDGGTIVVDEAYIEESIRNPSARIVKGFFDLMPQLDLSKSEIDAIIAYIKSLQ